VTETRPGGSIFIRCQGVNFRAALTHRIPVLHLQICQSVGEALSQRLRHWHLGIDAMTGESHGATAPAAKPVLLAARVAAFVAAALVVTGLNLVPLAIGWVLMLEGPNRKGIVPTAVLSVVVVAINTWLYVVPFS